MWNRRLTLSNSSILLFPKERQLRLMRVSRFSILVMLLLKSERSVNLVSFSNPSMADMLLKDRSVVYMVIRVGDQWESATLVHTAQSHLPSHSRLTKWSRCSILEIKLLSRVSILSLLNPTRLSITLMCLKDKCNEVTSPKSIWGRGEERKCVRLRICSS